MSEQRTVKEYAAMVHGLGDVDAVATIIQHAILGERKRCAEVARQMLVYADTTSRADKEIYRAIMGDA